MLAILGRIFVKNAGAPDEHSGDGSPYIADLYQKYRVFLFQKAGLYTNDTCAKEDIIQNTIIRLMRREELLRTMKPAALVSYMALTVRSAALNYLRSEHRDRLDALPLPDDDDEQECFQLDCSVQLTLEEQMLKGQRDQEVRAAIERLPERDRAALVGKYFLELDNRELAELLGVTPGALRTLLCRARGRALKELEKEGIVHE